MDVDIDAVVESDETESEAFDPLLLQLSFDEGGWWLVERGREGQLSDACTLLVYDGRRHTVKPKYLSSIFPLPYKPHTTVRIRFRLLRK